MYIDSTLNYLLFCLAIFTCCYLNATYLVKHAKFAFVSTLVVLFVLFAKVLLGDVAAIRANAFNTVKMLSVLVPIAFYAWFNLNSEKLSPKKKKWVGWAFDIVLALNIGETILAALIAPQFESYIYIGLTVSLTLATFKLKWVFSDSILGFNHPVWVINYALCLSYLYLFIFPIGPGLFAFITLYVCYFPFSRLKEKWFAYRAYSLWTYFIFFFILELQDTIMNVPEGLSVYLALMRESYLKHGLLICCAGAAVMMWQKMLFSPEQKSSALHQAES